MIFRIYMRTHVQVCRQVSTQTVLLSEIYRARFYKLRYVLNSLEVDTIHI